MIYIVITLLFFISTAILHLLSHKILVMTGKTTFKSAIVMPIGISVYSFITIYQLPSFLGDGENLWTVPLPACAITLYAILTGIYLIYFTNAYYGESSPTGKIYLLLKEKGKATFEQIIDEFSNKDLIGKRLDNLVAVGLIRKRDKTFFPTSKAQKITEIIDLYRKLLGWDKGG